MWTTGWQKDWWPQTFGHRGWCCPVLLCGARSSQFTRVGVNFYLQGKINVIMCVYMFTSRHLICGFTIKIIINTFYFLLSCGSSITSHYFVAFRAWKIANLGFKTSCSALVYSVFYPVWPHPLPSTAEASVPLQKHSPHNLLSIHVMEWPQIPKN